MRRLIRLGKDEVIEPDLWRRALSNVVFAPFACAWGVFWVSYMWLHDALIWVPCAYVALIVIWSVGSWYWLRHKGGPANQAAARP